MTNAMGNFSLNFKLKNSFKILVTCFLTSACCAWPHSQDYDNYKKVEAIVIIDSLTENTNIVDTSCYYFRLYTDYGKELMESSELRFGSTVISPKYYDYGIQNNIVCNESGKINLIIRKYKISCEFYWLTGYSSASIVVDECHDENQNCNITIVYKKDIPMFYWIAFPKD